MPCAQYMFVGVVAVTVIALAMQVAQWYVLQYPLNDVHLLRLCRRHGHLQRLTEGQALMLLTQAPPQILCLEILEAEADLLHLLRLSKDRYNYNRMMECSPGYQTWWNPLPRI